MYDSKPEDGPGRAGKGRAGGGGGGAAENLGPEERLAGFRRWCEEYARIEDKASHSDVPFRWYDCQREVAERLVRGEWLWILKARRLGMTWLLAAYSLWLATRQRARLILVLNQDRQYAEDFLDRCRYIHERLPEDLQSRPRVNHRARLEFHPATGGLGGGVIRSLAVTRRAIRSLAADLVVLDEAAFMSWGREARLAAQPAVETGGGQVVGISTSRGPEGDFYEVWRRARDSELLRQAGLPAPAAKYAPLFFGWQARPGRDRAWYEAESAANAGDPLYMKWEYPSTPEEAFECGRGRVFPLFAPRAPFVAKLDLLPGWPRYRALDWGGVDPFVCLWACEIPGDGPGLTVAPDCTNLIREMLAYQYDPRGAPVDRENHACDALRYLVTAATSRGLRGHVHLYRELYEPHRIDRGLSLPDLARRIVELTGSETIRRTVGDPSSPANAFDLSQFGVATDPAAHLRVGWRGEIEEGLARINELLIAAAQGISPAPESGPKRPRGFRDLPGGSHPPLPFV